MNMVRRYQVRRRLSFFFFFNDTATTEIYTLSLHDALPISNRATGAANSVLEREPHLHIHLAIVSRAATSTPGSEPAGQTPVLSEERRSQIAARRTPVDVIQHVRGVEAQHDGVPPAGRLSCGRRTHHARRRRRHHPAARRRSAATAHAATAAARRWSAAARSAH